MSNKYEGLVGVIFEWQILIGSITGGMIALMAALIVAHVQTRRDQRAAAALIAADIAAVQFVSEHLPELAAENGIPEERYHYWLSEKLSRRYPQLSTLFDSSMARLIDIHPSLSAHLSLFKMAYSDLEECLERIKDDKRRKRASEPTIMPQIESEEMRADMKTVANGLHLSGEHAKYIQYYIGNLILSRFPILNRIRMHVAKNDMEQASEELLRKGRP